MKLIDADKLIEELDTRINLEPDSIEGVLDAYAKKIIEDAQTVEIPQWIPVEERLPSEDGENVICCTEGGIIEICAFYNGDEIYPIQWCSNGNVLRHVVAWQPLPQPFKKED